MMTRKSSAEKTVRDIRRATRKHYSSEEKIRIVLEGLRGEESVAVLCRREGINANVYYRWSKDFLEAGKKRLSGDTVRGSSHNFLSGAACIPCSSLWLNQIPAICLPAVPERNRGGHFSNSS